MFKLNRKYTALFHLGIWSVLFLCIVLWRNWNHGLRVRPLTNFQVLVFCTPYIALYYFHAYWLMPRYFFRGRRLAYTLLTLAALLTVVGLTGLVLYMNEAVPAGLTYAQSAVRRIFPGLFFLMASASVAAFRENFRLEKSRKVKETEHLRTELSFLRTQVNPHFMLNVLNSMVFLARKRSGHLEPALLELARLMNYMLNDANNERICLEDEIGFLKAYIDLQMLRFGDDVSVQFNAPEHTNGKCIEPMLLIPLVENAFKHGIGLVEDPLILIDIRTDGRDRDERFSMTVRNKYNPLVRDRENRPSGIGLGNLTKRLELIYPGRFELTRSDPDTDHWFVITLNIPLE
jgi:two-component system LytT family sensor kinase